MGKVHLGILLPGGALKGFHTVVVRVLENTTTKVKFRLKDKMGGGGGGVGGGGQGEQGCEPLSCGVYGDILVQAQAIAINNFASVSASVLGMG